MTLGWEEAEFLLIGSLNHLYGLISLVYIFHSESPCHRFQIETEEFFFIITSLRFNAPIFKLHRNGDPEVGASAKILVADL